MSNAIARQFSRWAITGLLLAVVAPPAQAQLGRLKKLGADAVKDAAKDKLAGKKDSATTSAEKGGTSTTAAAKPAARKVDNSLNDDRIALVLASLQPMVADAQKRQELARVMKAHAAKADVSRACMDALTKSFNPMTMGSMSDKTSAELERLGKQSEAASDRLAAAIKRDDKRAWLFVQDTVNVLMQRTAILTMGGKCTLDYTPAAIIEAQVAAQSRTVTSEDMDGGTFDPPAAAKENLTRTQFGIIRERIALWALLQENPTLKGVGTEGVFTAEEQAALTLHAANIKKLAPFFKDSSLRWSTWEDLKSW